MENSTLRCFSFFYIERCYGLYSSTQSLILRKYYLINMAGREGRQGRYSLRFSGVRRDRGCHLGWHSPKCLAGATRASDWACILDSTFGLCSLLQSPQLYGYLQSHWTSKVYRRCTKLFVSLQADARILPVWNGRHLLHVREEDIVGAELSQDDLKLHVRTGWDANTFPYLSAPSLSCDNSSYMHSIPPYHL